MSSAASGSPIRGGTPQRIEYIRPEKFPEVDPRQVGLWKLWHLPHVAYRVDDLEAAIRGQEVVLGPFEPGDFGQVVFVHEDGVVIECLRYTRLDTWFGQPTPWRPAGPAAKAWNLVTPASGRLAVVVRALGLLDDRQQPGQFLGFCPDPNANHLRTFRHVGVGDLPQLLAAVDQDVLLVLRASTA